MAKLAALLVMLLTGLGAARALAADRSCRPMAFEGTGFTVCRYDPGRDELRLAARGPAGPLDSLAGLRAWLGGDARRAAFAMNAGMYDPAQAPLGLFVEGGRTVRPLDLGSGEGNFYLKPGGVFWTDPAGAPHIDETGVFAARSPAAAWATQSGPLLVSGGALHPAISPNGTSLTVRDAVGVKGREAVFVISDGPVSLGRLARFLRDGLGCPDALYLDGHVSSLWAPGLRRQDGRTGLGTFVVVLRKGKAGRGR
ncbi:MAG TPA: phosphodiester glycosidase family protein [Caulobacteraceae bacterium]